MVAARHPRIEDSQALRYRFMEMEDRYRKQALAMACSLVSIVDLRDAFTGGHSSRVAEYVRAMGLRLGLPDAQLDNVVMASLLPLYDRFGLRLQFRIDGGVDARAAFIRVAQRGHLLVRQTIYIVDKVGRGGIVARHGCNRQNFLRRRTGFFGSNESVA